MTSSEPPHLSVVATSRNDNHGKNLLYRMQHFVDGFIQQCKKHELKAELILVEWNPPEETLALKDALHFPEDKGPVTVRIIRVPKEIHSTLNHADNIPLFQMIGKNVGIRRATGKFILATNIDILFSDMLMKFMKNKLKPGVVYRTDRLDVPTELPNTPLIDEILHFCSTHFFRRHQRLGTVIFPKQNSWGKFLNQLRIYMKKLFIFSQAFFMKLIKAPLPFLTHSTPAFLKSNLYHIAILLGKIINYLICRIYPDNSINLHTNACGDFTLLSTEDWQKLKGYLEWNIFSWHIDSLLLYQARQHKIKHKSLPKNMPIYHIEHEIASGYTPEGAKQLFQRLDKMGIPYLTDKRLKMLRQAINRSSEKVVYNDNNWGMSNILLEEFLI